MSAPRMEVREYVSTIHIFFNAEGNVIGEEPQNDATWSDTLESREMTADECADWGLDADAEVSA